jgi:two-component system, chemotaxis family, chemotaxis protein CheY
MKRVLVIDDAVTQRLYHRQILEGGGFAVEEAVNGYEGLEKLLAAPFDLCLVDVNMPIMDGLTMVRRLRAEASIAAMPVIMISTEAKDLDATQAYAAGANLYLVKPITAAELLLNARLVTGVTSP